MKLYMSMQQGTIASQLNVNVVIKLYSIPTFDYKKIQNHSKNDLTVRHAQTYKGACGVGPGLQGLIAK